jgi:hypothetical protein
VYKSCANNISQIYIYLSNVFYTTIAHTLYNKYDACGNDFHKFFFFFLKKKLNTLTLLYKECTIIVHKTLLYLFLIRYDVEYLRFLSGFQMTGQCTKFFAPYTYKLQSWILSYFLTLKSLFKINRMIKSDTNLFLYPHSNELLFHAMWRTYLSVIILLQRTRTSMHGCVLIVLKG